MWAVVGLGNPGSKYALTRHNIGFMAVDALARSLGVEINKTDFKAHVLKCKIEDQDVVFVKPQTYMNLSGESVIPLMQFYKIEPAKLIVLHDELDLPFGKLKIQKNRGPGGHNGLKSINEQLGHQDYIRVKLGVGRPSHPGQPVVDFVLQNFNTDENNKLVDFLNLSGDAVESILFDGYERASNKFNSKDKTQEP